MAYIEEPIATSATGARRWQTRVEPSGLSRLRMDPIPVRRIESLARPNEAL
ncbi:hypothetical protein [Nitrosospira sp. Nsp2]|uniref:hypothetical protein n=1 Tax=Nitrosospira sp. Nsp2 TaxID=136548 RepID=UPI0015E77771|nr:hypothetical protein [Nitrosospira sp. Nsp2]